MGNENLSEDIRRLKIWLEAMEVGRQHDREAGDVSEAKEELEEGAAPVMSPKFGNISGSFGLIIHAQSFIFHNLCIIFSMFVSFVRIRVDTVLGG